MRRALVRLYRYVSGQVVERGGSDVRARHGEGGQGFKQPADHDTSIVLPGVCRAAVPEGPAQVPGEETKTEAPKHGEGGIRVEIEFGRERAEGVEDACHDQSNERKDGDGQQLGNRLAVDVKWDERELTTMKVQGM